MKLCIFFSFCTGAAAQEKLSYEKVLETAVNNNFDIQLKKAALLSASGQYKQAVGETDITVGAAASYQQTHKPVDSDDVNYYYGDSNFNRTWYNEKIHNPSYLAIDDTVSKETDASVWASKLFSFGLNTKLSYSVTRQLSQNNYIYDSKWGNITIPDDDARNYGTLKLEMSLPLFKSFNDSITGNNIKAAKASLDRMKSDLSDTISKTVLSASSAYWNYLQAHNKFTQLKKMYDRIVERRKNLEQLITSGVRSRNDMLELQVNEIAVQRDVLSAQTDLNNCLLQLRQIMGVQNDTAQSAEPDYTFPDFENITLPSPDSITEDSLSKITDKRPDIQALKKQMEAAQFAMHIADVNTRPDANLNFSIGTTGATYSDSYSELFSSGTKNIKGANLMGGLAVSIALPNNSKKGAQDTAMASYKQAQIQMNQIITYLALQLKNITETMNSYHIFVIGANEALTLQETLYHNEQKRFDAGLITINDILNQDDKYLSAQIQYYQILITYLNSILEFKYYTGDLVTITGADTNSVQKTTVYAIDDAGK